MFVIATEGTQSYKVYLNMPRTLWHIYYLSNGLGINLTTIAPCEEKELVFYHIENIVEKTVFW